MLSSNSLVNSSIAEHDTACGAVMAKQRSITFFPGSTAKWPRLTSSEDDSDIGSGDLLSDDD